MKLLWWGGVGASQARTEAALKWACKASGAELRMRERSCLLIKLILLWAKINKLSVKYTKRSQLFTLFCDLEPPKGFVVGSFHLLFGGIRQVVKEIYAREFL